MCSRSVSYVVCMGVFTGKGENSGWNERERGTACKGERGAGQPAEEDCCYGEQVAVWWQKHHRPHKRAAESSWTAEKGDCRSAGQRHEAIHFWDSNRGSLDHGKTISPSEAREGDAAEIRRERRKHSEFARNILFLATRSGNKDKKTEEGIPSVPDGFSSFDFALMNIVCSYLRVISCMPSCKPPNRKLMTCKRSMWRRDKNWSRLRTNSLGRSSSSESLILVYLSAISFMANDFTVLKWSFRMLIIENFIPPEEKEKITNRAVFDEEEDTWKIEPLAKFGLIIMSLKCQ